MNTSINNSILKPFIVKSEKKIEIHRAGWIIIDPWHIIKNGYIKTENRIIKEVSDRRTSFSALEADSIIDHGSGVLMSPLVNAHTHLELSCFKDKLNLNKGFEAWVRELLKLRESTDEKIVIDHAKKSAADLYNSGVLYAGDISTTGVTKKIFEKSPLFGVWFHEFLGTKIDKEEFAYIGKSGKFHCSVAGHAPHTSSPALLKHKKADANSAGLPFSLHVDESMAEREFITTGKGKWADFLKERKIDFYSWNLPQKSPVVHLLNHDLLDPLTLMVHVLNADDKELELIKKSGAKVCVCPRSNMNLHGKLPQLEKMLKVGIKPALGTDSLASCDSLSIFDEMKYLKKNFKKINPASLIAMATQYGADALGLGKYTGSLEKGKSAEMLYIPLKAKIETELLEKITEYEW
jgi:aminodeoxyfutalosine deaminase